MLYPYIIWDYRRLVEELEIAYGPSSDHAAAVAVELRQRVCKPGETRHVFMGEYSCATLSSSKPRPDLISVSTL